MPDSKSSTRLVILSLVVAGAALWSFIADLNAEPFFIDESAHVHQSYYYRLLLEQGPNHEDWLHPAAYDHLPVYKYLIGLALDCVGQEPPVALEGLEAWYAGDRSPPADAGVLRVARVTMLLGAVGGCVAILLLGREISGPWTGLLAAALLAASPLYRTHARRAMADDLVQALILVTFFVQAKLAHRMQEQGRWQSIVSLIAAGGLACGLAAATKLNGAVAGMSAFLLALTLGWRVDRHPELTRAVRLRFAGATMGMLLAGLAVFIAINPFFYARPNLSSPEVRARLGRRLALIEPVAGRGVWGRLRHLLDYRRQALRESVEYPNLRHLALPGPVPRLAAIVSQGMGGHSAFGRLPLRRIRWTAPVLLVLAGMWAAWRLGRSQMQAGNLPVAWLLVIWPLTEVVMLLPNLTLDFDRYYLGVVTWTSLLSAYAVTATGEALRHRLVLEPPDHRRDHSAPTRNAIVETP